MKAAAVSPSQLRAEIAAQNPPLLIDVRRGPAFLGAGEMIAGALRREPEQARAWAGSLPKAGSIVVYCVHGHGVSQGAAAALSEAGIAARYLEGGVEEWKVAQGPLDRKPRDASTRWVTRERPKIDRIACPWLIARFIDPGAQFLYVPAKQVQDAAKEKEAVPYDIPGVHFGHQGELCSFDAFVNHYRLHDAAIQKLALIVRAADTGHPELAPQAPGLLAISAGLSRNFQDDHEMLKHGMVMYDALYAWCQQ